MNTIILFWYLLCHGGLCEPVPFEVSREAAAIIACESGDTKNIGSYAVSADNPTSTASGLFQFIDGTYEGLTGRTSAKTDKVENQYAAFRKLWNNGYGWTHWTASKSCWSRWLKINKDGMAVWR
jgi:hypothetical protein